MSSKHPNEMSRHSGITKVHKHTPSGISNSLQTLWAKKQKAQEECLIVPLGGMKIVSRRTKIVSWGMKSRLRRDEFTPR